MNWNIVSRIDWDMLLKAAGIIIGVVVSFYQLRNIMPRSRSTLKIDLEILKLLEPSDPNYSILKAHIDKSIQQTYRLEQQQRFTNFHVYSWGDFIFGVIFAFVFSIGTLYLLKDGFTWWVVLTIFLALGGIGGILNGLEKKPEKPSV
jgi:hypothetical protein